MFTTKKSLLLLFFLGMVSLALCEQERDANEEERRDELDERDVEAIKRGLLSKVLGVGKKVLCGVSGLC
uniref:Nigrocin-2P n=1 Tax=Lithobates palustris TaxID=298395 RepID=B0B3Q2_LITPA|nr:nigrocin-2P precursor [Lithobates palustris]